jgi:hypothetical protein
MTCRKGCSRADDLASISKVPSQPVAVSHTIGELPHFVTRSIAGKPEGMEYQQSRDWSPQVALGETSQTGDAVGVVISSKAVSGQCPSVRRSTQHLF